MRLLGKVILIIGVSENIGDVVGLLFAQEGANLIIADIDEERAKNCSVLIKENGGNAFSLPVNASNEKDVKNLIEKIVKNYGQLDVLLCSISGGWVEIDKKMHQISNLAMNSISNGLSGVINTNRLAVEQMLNQPNGGAIINVAASKTVRRMANPIYSASKAAIIEFTKNIAHDYKDQKIRANCLCPGLFTLDQKFTSPIEPEKTPLIRRATKKSRQGSPVDFAYAALFLASDESSFITGQCLTVDGGDELYFPVPDFY